MVKIVYRCGATCLRTRFANHPDAGPCRYYRYGFGVWLAIDNKSNRQSPVGREKARKGDGEDVLVLSDEVRPVNDEQHTRIILTGPVDLSKSKKKKKKKNVVRLKLTGVKSKVNLKTVLTRVGFSCIYQPVISVVGIM